jgi:uncharacterized protein (DUF305 family)
MRITATAAGAAWMFIALTPAFGQDPMSIDMPAACQNAFPQRMMMEGMPMHMMMQGMQMMPMRMTGMQQHQQDMMQMMQTMHPMMMGMMATDPDVAFACAMIPHHQGAIQMAQAELEHGDAEPMQDMARKIIEAQEKEIATLVEWIEEQDQ